MAEVKERRKRRGNYLQIYQKYMKVYVLQVAKCFNAEHSFYFRLLGKSFNRWKIVSWQLGDHTNGDYVLS